MTSDMSSGSLCNLSSSYPYLQGIEISTQAQYDAGLVKIWSGEAGHQCAQLTFDEKNEVISSPFADGLSTSFNVLSSTVTDFNDGMKFPVLQYPMQNVSENPGCTTRTFPYKTFTVETNSGTKVVYRLDQDLESTVMSSIVEPLAIRLTPSFYSNTVPINVNRVLGFAGQGNPDLAGASDQVVTVDCFLPGTGPAPFTDDYDCPMTLTPPSHRPAFFSAPAAPFNDVRYVRNVPPTTTESMSTLSVMSLMTGSTDNYVRYDEVSSMCGWYYDNNSSVGTDSLAFGGMTY